MILAPTNDEACLGQLTQIARELSQTTLIRTVGERLGSRSAVVVWLQSLPQTDDDGSELYRSISCDIPQRVRLLPDDPNCFERSLAALALLEVVDPRTIRKVVTADKPARHTGVVEWNRSKKQWVALDLFPRRNFSWGRLGGNVLGGIREVHHYVGKPVMTFYGLGGVAELMDQKGAELAGAKAEKKPTPPAGGIAAPGSLGGLIGALAAAGTGRPEATALAQGLVQGATAVVGAGGKPNQEPGKGAGNAAQKETTQRAPQTVPAGAGAQGRNRDPLEAPEEERFDWWGLQ